MNTTVRALLPYRTRQNIRAWLKLPFRLWDLINNYFYDLLQFTRYSSSLDLFSSRQQKQSWIDADCHKLEKGLALKFTKPGFGKAVAERLVRNINDYRDLFNDDPSVQNAINVLSIYQSFNLSKGFNYCELFSNIESLKPYKGPSNNSGYLIKNKTEWLNFAQKDLLPFFKSRHSLRDFSDLDIEFNLILQAVEMAMYTPTVCNRQAARVHAYLEQDEIQKVINCQMGNAGFGKDVKALLMVTVNRECFFSSGERNQCWIDGGLFSMSLIYALHSLGLGTCCLNWSVTKDRDQLLRKVVNIQASEAVIMMVAVGHLKEKFKVAVSARKQIGHFLILGI